MKRLSILTFLALFAATLTQQGAVRAQNQDTKDDNWGQVPTVSTKWTHITEGSSSGFELITRTPEQLKAFEATDIYHQMLEASIRRQPELWLWSHNRWKRTREEFNERFQVVNGKVVPREGCE